MESHYDNHYFFADRYGPKKYTRPDGSIGEFGYTGGGLWNFKRFLDKLTELLGKPTSILDIGAGCGGWVATCNGNGIEALGLEFSHYAISHAILGAGPFLKRWDIETLPWPIDHPYDWVTAIDLFEHLFADRVDEVIAEAKRVAKHWIIAKICTAQLPHEVWAAKRANYKEVLAQAEAEGYEWLVVSGHINSQFPAYWINKFTDEDWALRPDLSWRLKGELDLPEDWRTTLILERRQRGPVTPLPTKFTADYYGEKYFADTEGRAFRRPDGSVDCWGYRNPEGEFLGAKEITQAWKTVFDPTNMLDVGAGRGTFIAYARDAGIQAEGFDYSEWAIRNRYVRCKPEWLRLLNATKVWPYPDRHFDLVTALDFCEHIYEEDLPFVIGEMFRVAKKWVFLQIAVPGTGGVQGGRGEGYVLKRGESVPLEFEECAVAGHVTLRPEQWWYEQLDREEWLPRRDLVTYFCTLAGPDTIKNWLANSMIVLERTK